jgi:hypothetical protein
MKKLQQGGAVAATATAAAATAGEVGGSSSAGHYGVTAGSQQLASSSSSASSSSAAAAAAPAGQSGKKGATKAAASKWSGVVVTQLPGSVVEALEKFESAEGLGFLQSLCAWLISGYKAGVKRDGVGLMAPLEDWEIFPQGYTGALLCNEVQLCAPLLAEAPYRVACN